MTPKQILAQGPTFRNETAFGARIDWYDQDTMRRFDDLRRRLDERRTAIRAAHRRNRRRIGLSLK